MSTSTHLAAARGAIVAIAVPSEDIFQKINRLGSSAKGSAVIVGSCVAVLIVIIVAARAKGAIAGIISGGLTAMVLIWFLNNVNNADLQKSVTQTVNSNNGLHQIVPNPDRELRPPDSTQLES